MSRRKELVTAAGTLLCALGIGFAMQSFDTSARYAAPVKTASAVPPVSGERPVKTASLDVQDITLTSALPSGTDELSIPTPLGTPEAIKVASTLPVPGPQPETPAIPTVQCDIVATAAAAEDMFVDIALNAACLPNERVTVHHNGMMFSAVTDFEGAVELSVPALSEKSVFIFAFQNGDGAVAEATVPGADALKRVVLQWKGNVDFQLHALEFGAGYNEDGHVWRESRAMGYRSAGYLTALGKSTVSEPLLAEVYTFPINPENGEGRVALSIEAPVSTRNCGREIEAQSIEMSAGGGLRTRDLMLAVPGCDALGDYLVLNNVFEDLTIAAR